MVKCFSSGGRPVFPMGGQVHNSSAYSADGLDRALLALKAMHANAVEIPVYWEQVEPEEGKFNFEHVGDIWRKIRDEGLYLILLWFGTWKNGTAKYVPEWVKADGERFARVQAPDGTTIGVLSACGVETMQADARAFEALCVYLKELDPNKETLIGLQVENEPGIMNGPARDYSPQAERQFQAPLPEQLVHALRVNPQSQISETWRRNGAQTSTWETAFGEFAQEYFSAYATATYIDYVAARGQKKYDITLYTNVWVEYHRFRMPGLDYPAGGAVTRVLDIWKWATPHLAWISPDIYQQTRQDYMTVCGDYMRQDNPLFVPESGPQEWNARFLFEAVGRFHAIGYFIFGLESLVESDGSPSPGCIPAIGSMRALAALSGALPFWQEQKIEVVFQDEYAVYQYIAFEGWTAVVRFTTSGAALGLDTKDWNWHDYRHKDYLAEQMKTNRRGRGLIVQTDTDEFVVAGDAFRVWFVSSAQLRNEPYAINGSDFCAVRAIAYRSVEEGTFDRNGLFTPVVKRNGDELDFGVWVDDNAPVVRARMWNS